MKKFFTKTNKNQKGFTLIELLIVIVILGVLAAAIIPNLSKFVGSGNVGAANAELATVKTAVSAYTADNNGFFPCGAQPALTSIDYGTSVLIVAASIQPYISSATIKGTYNVDHNGVVYCVSTTQAGTTFAADHLTWIKN